jgi:hypothetical protein
VNTKRSTNQAVKILREYLEEKAQSNNWIVFTQWTGHVNVQSIVNMST